MTPVPVPIPLVASPVAGNAVTCTAAGQLSIASSAPVLVGDKNQPNGVVGIGSDGSVTYDPILVRTGTAAALAAFVPQAGQHVYATDSHKLVIGDGTTTFASLSAFALSSALASYLSTSGGSMSGDIGMGNAMLSFNGAGDLGGGEINGTAYDANGAAIYSDGTDLQIKAPSTGIIRFPDVSIDGVGNVRIDASDGGGTLTFVGGGTGKLDMGGQPAINFPSPSAATDAANKAYVDAVASGLDPKNSVRAATIAALPANTYANGTAGVGATLTANANGALAAVDGITLIVGNRLLVQNEVAAANNGIYALTQLGDGSHPYILTRTIDANSATVVTSGMFTFVEEGTKNAAAGFVLSTTGAITIGTTALTFTQFSGAGEITNGAGLAKSGNTLSVATGGVTNAMLAGSIAASKLVGTDITVVSTIVTGVWNGTKVGLAYGGSNADLSATGGAGQYVKQSSSGAALTVGTIPLADLPGSIPASKLVVTDIVVAESAVTGLVADLALKAPLASPALTGTPTAPTAAANTNTTQLATTAYVVAAIPSVANPTATIGLTVVNGSATTPMRSDGAPALDVTISPTWSGAHTFSNAVVGSKRITSGVVSAGNQATTYTTDASLGNEFNLTLTGNVTLANPTNGVDGQVVRWQLAQDATGSRTLTLGANFNTTAIGTVTASTTASAIDYLCAIYRAGATKWDVVAFSRADGGNAVTSVALALPGIFTVSGSPVTSTGTLTGALANQSPNLVWAGPASGGAAVPTFRALVAADLPAAFGRCTADVAFNNVTSYANVTGLSFAIGANEIWSVEFNIAITTSGAAAGILFQVTGPASPTDLNINAFGDTSLVAVSSSNATAFSTPTGAFGSTALSGGTVRIVACINNGANAGTVQLQAAANAASLSTNSVLRDSYMVARKMA